MRLFFSLEHRKKNRTVIHSMSRSRQFESDHIAVVVRKAATGYSCTDRAPCRIVIACKERVLLDAVVRVPGLVSPLTVHTHLTAEEIAAGEDWFEVRNKAQAIIDEYPVYVGQHMKHVHECLDLSNGVVVELSQFFMIRKNGKKRHFDLRTLCDVFLGACPEESSAVSDCAFMWELYWVYEDRMKYGRAKLQKLDLVAATPSPLVIEGVCMCRYRPRQCKCSNSSIAKKKDAPFFSVTCRNDELAGEDSRDCRRSGDHAEPDPADDRVDDAGNAADVPDRPNGCNAT